MASVVGTQKSILAESPIYDSNAGILYYVDFYPGRVNSLDVKTNKEYSKEIGIVTTSICKRKSGGFISTLKDGFYGLDERFRLIGPIVKVPMDDINRFNDGKCDPLGRFWAGTKNMAERTSSGALYRLDPDHTLSKVVEGLTVSNGITWSPDHRRMYHIDSPVRKVTEYRYDTETGRIGDARTAISFAGESGVPDGMTTDCDGMLWIAHFGGSRVSRWNPGTGKKLSEIGLPASIVSSCIFGGNKMNKLYITTGKRTLSPQELGRQPLAGSIFVSDTDTEGLRCFEFEG